MYQLHVTNSQMSNPLDQYLLWHTQVFYSSKAVFSKCMSTHRAVPVTSVGIIFDKLSRSNQSPSPDNVSLNTSTSLHFYFHSAPSLNCKSFLTLLPTTIFHPITYSPQKSVVWPLQKNVFPAWNLSVTSHFPSDKSRFFLWPLIQGHTPAYLSLASLCTTSSRDRTHVHSGFLSTCQHSSSLVAKAFLWTVSST